MARITISVSDRQAVALREVAGERGLSVSSLLRSIIADWGNGFIVVPALPSGGRRSASQRAAVEAN